MIVYQGRTLDVYAFAEKYPSPHVVIGHYNPLEQVDEEATGQPSFFGLLCSTLDALGLAGDWTGISKRVTATIKLSFAVAKDAARFSEIVDARPVDAVDECASVSAFVYDKALYHRLKVARDARHQAIREAMARGEAIEYVIGASRMQ